MVAGSLYTGAVDLGQGSDTVLAQMGAESVGVPLQQVKVVPGKISVTIR